MADPKFALSNANTLQLGAQQSEASSEDLHSRLKQLIADMEEASSPVGRSSAPTSATRPPRPSGSGSNLPERVGGLRMARRSGIL